MFKPPFTPSPQQEAVFEAMQDDTTGNLAILAVAGGGKTTTLVEGFNHLNPEKMAIMLAFNKSVAVELENRLPQHIKASTFHSFWFRYLCRSLPTRPEVSANKMRNILRSCIPDVEQEFCLSEAVQLCALAKNAGINPSSDGADAMLALAKAHGIVPEDPVTQDELALYAYRALCKSNTTLEIVDFDDMLYLPYLRRTPCAKIPYVGVDEIQDLNAVQRDLLKRMVHERVFGVGDPNQAIYAFRGAGTNSFFEFEEEYNVKTFPLSYSYRCAKKIVALAQTQCPTIQALPDAPEGSVEFWPREYSIHDIPPNSAILCRLNSPLVRMAFRLVSENIPCAIVDPAFAARLHEIGKRAYADTSNPINKLHILRDAHLSRSSARSHDIISDLYDTVEFIMEKCEHLGEYRTTIDYLFSNRDRGIRLSTVHRAKGLEWDTVFILGYIALMPFRPDDKSPGELQQEYNLIYVAVTRAINRLVMLPLSHDKE